MKSKKTSKPQKKIIHLVKRRGLVEHYDERKVYGSCYFACRNAHLSEQEAEQMAEKVSTAVTKWVNRKKVISSNEIFHSIIEELKKYNEDAAFLYETHRDIS
ncbi:MAG: ATP cone domain-containing protein [Nanoarchaeota archaeon]